MPLQVQLTIKLYSEVTVNRRSQILHICITWCNGGTERRRAMAARAVLKARRNLNMKTNALKGLCDVYEAT